MGGGGAPEVTKQTVVQELPPWVKSFSTRLMRQSLNESKRPYLPYTGDRIADLNQDITSAVEGTRGLVGQARESLGGARDLLDATVSGDYFRANPYLDATFGQAAQRVTDAYSAGTAAQRAAAAARSNALGSSGYNEMVQIDQRALGDRLNDLATQIYGGNYQQERDRQLAAVQGLGQLGQSGLQTEQALFGVGDALRGISQEDLDFLYGQFKERQDYPLRQLDILGSAITQALGRGSGSTTSVSPYMGTRSSPFANVLGGALGGAGLYGSLAENPSATGSIPYAALGGLLGGLGG